MGMAFFYGFFVTLSFHSLWSGDECSSIAGRTLVHEDAASSRVTRDMADGWSACGPRTYFQILKQADDRQRVLAKLCHKVTYLN